MFTTRRLRSGPCGIRSPILKSLRTNATTPGNTPRRSADGAGGGRYPRERRCRDGVVIPNQEPAMTRKARDGGLPNSTSGVVHGLAVQMEHLRVPRPPVVVLDTVEVGPRRLVVLRVLHRPVKCPPVVAEENLRPLPEAAPEPSERCGLALMRPA